MYQLLIKLKVRSCKSYWFGLQKSMEKAKSLEKASSMDGPTRARGEMHVGVCVLEVRCMWVCAW